MLTMVLSVILFCAVVWHLFARYFSLSSVMRGLKLGGVQGRLAGHTPGLLQQRWPHKLKLCFHYAKKQKTS